MIVIGMTQKNRVDPANTACPERRRDDSPADARIAHPSAIVDERPAAGRLNHDRQAVPNGQHLALQGFGASC